MLSVLGLSARSQTAVMLVVLGVWIGTGPACPKAFAATNPPPWSAIPLPGDRGQLCRIAGLDEHTSAARLPFELVRVLYGTPASAPPADPKTFAAVLDHLRRASDETGEGRDRVPLPLPAAVWRDVVLPAADARAMSGYRPPDWLSPDLARSVVTRRRLAVDDDHLLAVILSNRSAALIYYGLAALDADTLAYIGRNPGLLAWITTERPGTFAASAGALVLVRDIVQLPGGEDAKPLWTAIVGEPPSNAGRFIKALLTRDSGRLAYFFDSLSALDQPHLRFALGAAASEPKARAARFRQLYAAFSGVDPDWSLESGPFTRRADDGRLLLSQLAVTSDGEMAAAAAAGVWRAVFDHNAPPRAGDDRPVDAVTIARHVLKRDASARRQGLRAVLFAQRVFAQADDRGLQSVIVALRGFQRFEALHLTIARMGITDPLIFAKASERAAAISGDGWVPAASPGEKATLLSQFQGALALIDHCAFRGTFDLRARRRLVETLVAVPSSPSNGYAGGIARWITTTALPELRAALNASASEAAEDLVLEGLAGMLPPGSSTLAAVRWEDHEYVIDQAGGDLARLLLVRRRQGGNRLDDVLALAEEAARLKEGTGADAVRLQRLAKSLRSSALSTAGAARWTDETLEAQLLEASRLASAGGPVKPEVAARLATLADEMLGGVLRALAYAAHIGDPESNLLLGPSLADDHDFTFQEPNVSPVTAGWALPTEQGGLGMPWHVSGSILCLEAVLGRFSLPRLMIAPTGPRRVGRRDEQVLAHAAVLVRPTDLHDAERDRLVGAIARGRELADAATEPGTILALGKAAGINPRRRNVLAWAAGQSSSRPSAMLTLTELLRIGSGTRTVEVDPAWGASSLSLDGCPCLRFPDEEPIDGYGRIPTAAAVASATPDLSLRLAEITARLGVPASVAALLLPDATQELIDTAHPAHADDWVALAEVASAISESRRIEKIASLTAAGGPLIPRGSAVRHD